MLIIYEYVITIPDEIELFWRGKVTGATVLFLANRYLSLVIYLYELLQDTIVTTNPNAKVRVISQIRLKQHVLTTLLDVSSTGSAGIPSTKLTPSKRSST